MTVHFSKDALNWKSWGEILKNALPGQVYYNQKTKSYQIISIKNCKRLKTYEVFKLTKIYFNDLKKTFDNSLFKEKMIAWETYEKLILQKKPVLVKPCVLFFQIMQNIFNGLGFRTNVSVAKMLSSQLTVCSLPVKKNDQLNKAKPFKVSAITSSFKTNGKPKTFLWAEPKKAPDMPWTDRLKELFDRFDLQEIKEFFKHIKGQKTSQELAFAMELVSRLDRAHFRKIIAENVFGFNMQSSPFLVDNEEASLLAELFTTKFFIYHEEILNGQLENPNLTPQFLIFCLRVFHETTYKPELGMERYHEISTCELFINELIATKKYAFFIEHLKYYLEDLDTSEEIPPVTTTLIVFLHAIIFKALVIDEELREQVLDPFLGLLNSCPELLKAMSPKLNQSLSGLSSLYNLTAYKKNREELLIRYPLFRDLIIIEQDFGS